MNTSKNMIDKELVITSFGGLPDRKIIEVKLFKEILSNQIYIFNILANVYNKKKKYIIYL